MDKWSLLLRLPCSAEKVGLLPGGLEVNVSGAPVRMISKGCCHLTDPESVCGSGDLQFHSLSEPGSDHGVSCRMYVWNVTMYYYYFTSLCFLVGLSIELQAYMSVLSNSL